MLSFYALSRLCLSQGVSMDNQKWNKIGLIAMVVGVVVVALLLWVVGREEVTIPVSVRSDQSASKPEQPLPTIHWGPVEELFLVKDPRLGQYAWTGREGQVQMLDAVVFEVVPKTEINEEITASLTATLYDQADKALGSGSIYFSPQEPRNAWDKGIPATGFITFQDFELSQIKTIRLSQRPTS